MSALEHDWPDPDRRDEALMRVLEDIHASRAELTNPELNVLKCAGAGLTAKESAAVLSVPFQNVERQLTTARAKMACKTTTQAVAEAIRKRLIP